MAKQLWPLIVFPEQYLGALQPMVVPDYCKCPYIFRIKTGGQR